MNVAPLNQVQIGWSGYTERDEHEEALGEVPHMPEMPGDDDCAASRIHARGQDTIDIDTVSPAFLWYLALLVAIPAATFIWLAVNGYGNPNVSGFEWSFRAALGSVLSGLAGALASLALLVRR